MKTTNTFKPTYTITHDDMFHNEQCLSKTYRGLKLFKYDKNKLNSEDWECVEHIGKMRSVIYDNSSVLCVAPVKSQDYTHFISRYANKDSNSWCIYSKQDEQDHSDEDYEYSPMNIDDIRVEEYIEGTMINVFYSPNDMRWKIATKSLIDANGSFFNSTLKFSDMFYDILDEYEMNLNDLCKDFCYSFVMRHPENRIVENIYKKEIILVGVYFIEQQTSKQWNVYSLDIHDTNLRNMHKHTTMEMIFDHTPKQYECNTPMLSEFMSKLWNTQTDYGKVGLMVYAIQYNTIQIPLNNEDGTIDIRYKSLEVRSKVRNMTYEHIRYLRGNQPKLTYHFCELYINNLIEEFLNYYPEYKKDYEIFIQRILKFEQQLFKYYRMCYMKKRKPLYKFEYIYRPHMFNIHHTIYKPQLKSKHKRVEISTIQSYIKQLHPSQLMYVLNRMQN